MERYEIGGDERLTSLVEAAVRGEEAVFTCEGEVVATVKPSGNPIRTRDGNQPRPGLDLDALQRLHDKLPGRAKGGGAALIRELRDAGY